MSQKRRAGRLGYETLGRSLLRLSVQKRAVAEAKPILFAKAAALFESLCNNHPFVDGNKRVA